MNMFQDLQYITGKVIKSSFKNIKSNPLLLLLVLGYSLAYTLLMGVSVLLLRSGFLLGLIQAILLAAFASSFFYQVRVATNNYKINLNDFRESFGVYFPQILIFIFFINILTFFLELLLVPFLRISPTIGAILYAIAGIVLFIILNPVPEVIYITRRTAMDAFTKAVEFVKENPVNWFVPNFIFIIVFFFIRNIATTLFFSIFRFSSLFGLFTWTELFSNLVVSILVVFIFVYRANLFDILNTSTVRKRTYQKQIYDNKDK